MKCVKGVVDWSLDIYTSQIIRKDGDDDGLGDGVSLGDFSRSIWTQERRGQTRTCFAVEENFGICRDGWIKGPWAMAMAVITRCLAHYCSWWKNKHPWTRTVLLLAST
ncbi:hypothetical protein V6N13_119552 [Hibiscus sabdariffa]|uniref:Uncharacterized protein n=1 Tax=Hibiscus sabdariffa TaxID=183260 RepID=A0ABR2E1K1_9ROSI